MNPCRRAAQQGILIFLAFLPISVVGSLRTIETSGFILAGADPQSLLYVSEMARRGVLRWNDAFGLVDEQSPAVLVHLNDEKGGVSDPGFMARFQGGKWVIEIEWHPATQRRTLSYALALGWWQRTALYSGGKTMVPAWLVAAAAAQLELDLNPLFRDLIWLELPADCHEQSLRKLWVADPCDPAGMPWIVALALYESLRAETELNHLQMTTDDWLQIDQPERLSEYLPKVEHVAKEQLHEVWWATVWSAAKSARRGPFRSLAESEGILSDLEQVVMQCEGRERLLLLRELMNFQPDLQLLRFFDQRKTAVEEELKIVHPVYHNAFLSLARSYQALAQQDFSTLQEHVRAFEEDKQTAERAGAEMQALLSPAPPDLLSAPNP